MDVMEGWTDGWLDWGMDEWIQSCHVAANNAHSINGLIDEFMNEWMYESKIEPGCLVNAIDAKHSMSVQHIWIDGMMDGWMNEPNIVPEALN